MKTKRYLRASLVAGVATAALVLAGCAGTNTGGAPAQTDSGGAITVWVDPPRVPAAEAFKAAYPALQGSW